MGMKVNGTSGLTFPDTTTLASAGQASVRAWVNFNGTGTVAIRASYNVTSITDNGVGNYTLNFTTALPDANYTPLGNNLQDTGANNGQVFYAVNPLAGSCTMKSGYVSSLGGTVTSVDAPYCWAAIFR